MPIIPYLLSLTLPLMLVPIEVIVAHPAIIEELFKFFIVVIFHQTYVIASRKSYIQMATCGLLFALSESILYLNRIIMQGNLSLFFIRIVLTGILHTATFIILYYFSFKNKYWIIFSLLFVISLDFLYNYFVAFF
jgi:hypothetical protein